MVLEPYWLCAVTRSGNTTSGTATALYIILRPPFAGALQRAEEGPQEDARLRTASRDLVSFSLLLPLLKQVRNASKGWLDW